MKTKASPKFLFSLSMAIFGTLGIFTRNIAVRSGELALYRAILAALLIFVYLKIRGEKIDYKSIKKELVLLVLS